MKIPFSYTFPEENRDVIVSYAWDYMPLLMVSFLFSIELECFKAYMLAHEVTTPFTLIHFTTTGFHVFWCWLLIDKHNLGVFGAGLSLIITEV
jgi:MATE family multidrug resistance protein